ncbi:MAG: hypothetical protein JO256_07360 [Alphaproteobacteria bacterium]|nr:hypothetical protein [Alphaproteobacteria bacterium]
MSEAAETPPPEESSVRSMDAKRPRATASYAAARQDTDSTDTKESNMEIHKPKPFHNWREFLKEYAIIVLGVATALAAEQAVEWLHWQGEVRAARQAIFAEIADDNDAIFSLRLALAPCLERQADEAGRILDDLEARRPPGHFTTFHAGYATALRDSDWQAERSAQSLTHFPRAELALIGRYYALFGEYATWMTNEREAWRALSVLRRPPKEVTASDLLRLHAVLMTARDTERLIKLNAIRQVNLSRQIGVANVSADQNRREKFCTLDYEAYNQYILSL